MAVESMPVSPRPEENHVAHCPKCRVGTLVRVEHQAGTRGHSYDRYFCPRCGSSVEVNGDGAGGDTAQS